MEIRSLFGGRDVRGQTIAFIGVGLGAFVLGFAAGSLGKQVQATRLARAEAANLELRESMTTLEEGLREARGPLQQRIQELETALAETEPPPPPLVPEESDAERQLRMRISELEADARRGESSEAQLEAEVQRLEKAVRLAERGRRDLKAANDRLTRRLGEMERAPSPALPAAPDPAASAPAPRAVPGSEPSAPTAAAPEARNAPPAEVAAAPTAASAPGSACGALDDPEFALALAGAAEQRLGGRLVMRLTGSEGALALELGEGDASYPVEPLPQHVSFDCAGTPYIVSVCSVEDGRWAKGVVWQADAWRDPCR